jgi:DNA-binding transcriptional ArsR family regulator
VNLKGLLYEQERVGKRNPPSAGDVGCWPRVKKTVEALTAELSIDIKLTSAHLKALKRRLVTARREGKYMVYQLSGPDVAGLWVNLREVAEEHLLELRVALDQMVADPAKLTTLNRQTLMDHARVGNVVVIDVRPQAEYSVGHLPFARSMPVDEIEPTGRTAADKTIVTTAVAFCLFSKSVSAAEHATA